MTAERANLRGAGLMVFAMAGFAMEDAILKLMTATLPMGQMIIMLGLSGAAVFAVLTRSRGEPVAPRAVFGRAVLLRNLGEAIGTLGLLTALALVPLSLASAILMALPLLATMGAALFLGEKVGWRRWTAIGVGFCGMLVIVRPWASGFDPAALFAVLGVAGFALRDVATRGVAGTVSSTQLAVWGFLSLLPAGLLVLPFGMAPRMPGAAEWGMLAAILALGVSAYWAMTTASRIADVSFIAPFRYARIIFALGLGFAAFNERPDTLMLAGSAMIVGSGLYTFFRERALSRPPRSR